MCNDVPGHVEELHIPFLLYSCKAAFWIQETSPRLSDVERSVVLQSVFVIGSILACCFSRNVPLTLHVTQFYQAFPALVLQATNAGVRRPGYEATTYLYFCYCCWSAQGAILHFASHPGLKPVHPSFIQYWTWGAQPYGWGPYSMLLPCYI